MNSIKCPSHITFVIPDWLNAQMRSWRYRAPAVYFDENSLTGGAMQFKVTLFKDQSYSRLDSSLLTAVAVQSLSHVWFWDPMNWSMPGFPFLHYVLEFAQTHAHWVNETIQPSQPLLIPSSGLCLSQHQGLFQWVSSSHQVSKGLELQLQHQSFQWIVKVDLGLTGLISLQSKERSRVFSNISVRKHQFFGAQPSSCFNSHIQTQLLEEP